MKKIMALVLAMLMAFACVAFAEEANVQTIQLGETALTVTVDAAYVNDIESDELAEESQVGYYHAEGLPLEFDVYVFATEGQTLAECVAEEAAEFESQPEEMMTINDIEVASYFATENDGEADFTTMTCIMQDGDNFVEIVFWLDGDDTEAAMAVLNTLAK